MRCRDLGSRGRGRLVVALRRESTGRRITLRRKREEGIDKESDFKEEGVHKGKLTPKSCIMVQFMSVISFILKGHRYDGGINPKIIILPRFMVCDSITTGTFTEMQQKPHTMPTI